MKNFALIGVGGFIAPRHLKAIKESGHNLVAALDKNDSVGILDSYFPNADFFIEFERFERHLERLRRLGNGIDYLVVCTPNYLHDAHIRFGLRIGADVICEKPLVLNPWNAEALIEMEKETDKKIYTIFQLRLHPAIIALKKKVSGSSEKHNVQLKYVTVRGNWYHISWKGDEQKSGGIVSNIGIHFLDILLWIFGDLKQSSVEELNDNNARGKLELQNASVKWELSIDRNALPENVKSEMQNSYRSLIVDDEEFDFSNGLQDLYLESYRQILNGQGFGTQTALPSIRLLHRIRHSQ
jgi:UDP-N-acetyl-2-amino-2-deoxyglucuronate dehydrogenase